MDNLCPRRVGILMIPGFSMMAFASAIEPLRAANRLARRDLYEWVLLSPDGGGVAASNGIRTVADAAIGAMPVLDMLFVCAGIEGQHFDDPETFRCLRYHAQAGGVLGGISSGPHILARAGLLNGYRCTIHWEDRPSFAEDFPNIQVTNSLYEIDRRRYTCAGGIAAMDMMLGIIAQDGGQALAVKVSDQFIMHHIRANTDRQQSVFQQLVEAMSPRLEQVIRHMESHIEDPLSIEQLAQFAGITARQLTRLFHTHFARTPAAYYRELRLNHAKHLVAKSGMSVTQIAIASGFVSSKHFSNAYRDLFGVTPAEDRKVVFSRMGVLS